MMKQDIKFFIRQERQKYVSPSVKVIEVAAQKVICQSVPNGTEQYQPYDW